MGREKIFRRRSRFVKEGGKKASELQPSYDWEKACLVEWRCGTVLHVSPKKGDALARKKKGPNAARKFHREEEPVRRGGGFFTKGGERMERLT